MIILSPHHCTQAINIIECPAFCRMLLILRHDLLDTDILRSTKMRELVLTNWKKNFDTLKAKLKVNIDRSLANHLITCPLEICRQNLVYFGHVVL